MSCKAAHSPSMSRLLSLQQLAQQAVTLLCRLCFMYRSKLLDAQTGIAAACKFSQYSIQ